MSVSGALLLWDYLAQREQPSPLRDRLLIATGIASLFAYANFGNGHFGNYVHSWDVFHRYIGAKYAPELGNERLYACTIIADTEISPVPESETVTDLKTGTQVSSEVFVASPDAACKVHFSDARWSAFTSDVAWFRHRVTARRWTEMKHDFGLNQSPMWMLLAFLLANASPPFPLTLLDPVLLLAAALFVLVAFGPRAFLVSSMLVGSNWALRFFYWQGGSMLVYAWLVLAVAAVCMWKMGRPGRAGTCLASSALLAGYPLLLFIGAAFVAVEQARLKKWSRPMSRFFLAAAIAGAVGFGSSGAVFGFESWSRFVSSPVIERPKTNTVGLATALAARSDHIGQKLHEEGASPWKTWQETRLADLEGTRGVRWGVSLAGLLLLFLAVRRTGSEPWLSVSLAAGAVPLLTSVVNFHYVVFMVLGISAGAKPFAALIACALAGWGLLIMLAPFAPQWLDEQSMWLSYGVMLVVVWWWALFASQHVTRSETPPHREPATL